LANLLEVHGWDTPKEENSSLFAHLESMYEDDEALGSLGRKENPEEVSWAGTSRCCKPERTKWHQGRSKWTSQSQSYLRWIS